MTTSKPNATVAKKNTKISYAKKNKQPTNNDQLDQELLQKWDQMTQKLTSTFKAKNSALVQKAQQQHQAIQQHFSEVRANMDDMKTYIMSRYSTHASTFQASMTNVEQRIKQDNSTIVEKWIEESRDGLSSKYQDMLNDWTQRVNQISIKDSAIQKIRE